MNSAVHFNTFFGRNRAPLPNAPVKFIREEFTTWDVARALAHFHRDYGGVPADLLMPQVSASVRMSRTQEELYTDLVEARAERRLPEMFEAFQSFMDEGE